MRCIEFNYEKKYVKDFLKLPKLLYDKNSNTENSGEIKKLLLGLHPLNKYFRLTKYLVYDREKVVGRFAMTTYDNDENCYIGFFESINDTKVASAIFESAKNFAKDNKYKKIIGPVDGSFWFKYRLKINLFDKKPYTGEPYNKDYYLKLFLENNFNIVEHYTSNIFGKVDDEYQDKRFKDKYDLFISNNYEIVSPKMEDYENIIERLYYLLSKLYSDFPMYKPINKEDFINIFSNYKYIINLDMVKLAYFKDELVGFFISVPNYNNLVYDLNISNIIKIRNIRQKPNEYVMLYMGVNPLHKGLGSAMVQSIIDTMKVNGCTSIGALARDGKVTQKFGEDLIINKYEYVLLEWSSYDKGK